MEGELQNSERIRLWRLAVGFSSPEGASTTVLLSPPVDHNICASGISICTHTTAAEARINGCGGYRSQSFTFPWNQVANA